MSDQASTVVKAVQGLVKSLLTMASTNFAMNGTEQRRLRQFAANLPKPTFQVGLSERPTSSDPGEDCRGSSRPATKKCSRRPSVGVETDSGVYLLPLRSRPPLAEHHHAGNLG